MISVENVSIRLGKFSLDRVSFEVPTGSHGVLMGKTGSGKTTLLEAVCGLKPVHAGCIRLMQRDVTALPPGARGIGFVPQDGALFSTMNVREHLAFALRLRKWTREDIAQRTDELADLLGIAHLLDRMPHGLSGGEKQRVSLGRALSARPDVLCLDEPLSALDEDTQDEICSLLESVRRHAEVTILHITHNLHETRRLADRVLVLADGVVRVDTPAVIPTATTGPPPAKSAPTDD